MKAFFAPECICVVGASADATRIGGRPIHYLKQAAFGGRVFPVNPNRTLIQGHRSFPSLRDLPERPDLAIIGLPRDAVLSAIRDCVDMKIPAVTIFSSGFAEVDATGRALQGAIAAAAHGTQTRVLGPNANGTMAPPQAVYACFTPVLERGLPAAGQVAIFTQSAAIGTYILNGFRERGIGIALWAHTGNESDVDLLDMLAFALEQDSVRMVILTSEVLRAPQRLRALLAQASRRGVLVAVLQVGQSAVGEAAAASHTGALVKAQSALTRGLFRQGGAVLAKSMRELIDIAEAHTRLGHLPGARIGILTPSGGIGIMIADALDGTSVKIPRFSQTLQAELLAAAPFCHAGNPVDVTAQIVNEPARFSAVIERMAGSGEVDAIISFLPVPSERDPLTQQLAAIAKRSCADALPVRFGVVGSVDEGASQLLHNGSVGIWAEPDDLRAAMAATARPAREPLVDNPAIRSFRSDTVRKLASAASAGVVGELDSKNVLRRLGLPVVPDVEVSTADAAVRAAADVGYPVALKLHAPGIAHKAAVGGVKLGLASADAVAEAARTILAGSAAGPGAMLLVEPMLAGIEIFVGVTETEEYGSLAMCGFGGGKVEEQARIAYRYLPVSRFDVQEMLAESGALPFFAATGRVDAVEQQLHQILQSLEQVLQEGAGLVRSIEINPVIVNVQGGCMVVDALIEMNMHASEEARVPA
jgi:acyl-CoA synthetase (NDP forming)